MHTKIQCVLSLFLTVIAFTESLDYRAKMLKNLENEVEKIKVIDLCLPSKINCEPRETYVNISSDKDKFKLITNVVLIKRCAGNCGPKVCKPTKTKNVIVRVGDILSKGKKCLEFQVEEHLECRCMEENKCKKRSNCKCDKTIDSNCASLKKWNRKTCSCVCKKRKVCSTGSKWDDSTCKCVIT